jgi:hypothetical protein
MNEGGRLEARMRALLARRAVLARQAARFVLDFYRRHRRLPAAYVTALLPPQAVRRLVMRGEIEHTLHVAGLARRLEHRVRKICRVILDATHVA